MTGFRLFDEDEAALGDAAAPPNAERLLRPAQRWHCGRCGRFVPSSTVKKIPPSGPDWIDEHEYEGVCATDGRVDVVWGEQ